MTRTCDSKWADAHISITGSHVWTTGGATSTSVVITGWHIAGHNAVATGGSRQTERVSLEGDTPHTAIETWGTKNMHLNNTQSKYWAIYKHQICNCICSVRCVDN